MTRTIAEYKQYYQTMLDLQRQLGRRASLRELKSAWHTADPVGVIRNLQHLGMVQACASIPSKGPRKCGKYEALQH